MTEQEAGALLDEAEREVLLSVKQYAARYGIHIQTVYTAIRLGRRLHGRVERPSEGTIRIAVPRESIITRKSA